MNDVIFPYNVWVATVKLPSGDWITEYGSSERHAFTLLKERYNGHVIYTRRYDYEKQKMHKV